MKPLQTLKAEAMSTALHFVCYSESLSAAHWRPTAGPVPDDGLHLTVNGVPDDVPVATVARYLNETLVLLPSRGAGRALHYDEIGRGCVVNLYR